VGTQLGIKRSFSLRQQHNFQLALLMLEDFRAGYLAHLVAAAFGILHFDGAAAADLEAIVKIGAGGERIRSKTGARIIDFQKIDCRAGSILDGRFDLIRMASAQNSKREQR
jgi:hypothetical protein